MGSQNILSSEVRRLVPEAIDEMTSVFVSEYKITPEYDREFVYIGSSEPIKEKLNKLYYEARENEFEIPQNVIQNIEGETILPLEKGKNYSYAEVKEIGVNLDSYIRELANSILSNSSKLQSSTTTIDDIEKELKSNINFLNKNSSSMEERQIEKIVREKADIFKGIVADDLEKNAVIAAKPQKTAETVVEEIAEKAQKLDSKETTGIPVAVMEVVPMTVADFKKLGYNPDPFIKDAASKLVQHSKYTNAFSVDDVSDVIAEKFVLISDTSRLDDQLYIENFLKEATKICTTFATFRLDELLERKLTNEENIKNTKAEARKQPHPKQDINYFKNQVNNLKKSANSYIDEVRNTLNTPEGKEKLLNYAESCSNITNRSLLNSVLLAKQFEERGIIPTVVKNYNDWKSLDSSSSYGVTPKRGQSGVDIITRTTRTYTQDGQKKEREFYRAEKVFDVSQTTLKHCATDKSLNSIKRAKADSKMSKALAAKVEERYRIRVDLNADIKEAMDIHSASNTILLNKNLLAEEAVDKLVTYSINRELRCLAYNSSVTKLLNPNIRETYRNEIGCVGKDAMLRTVLKNSDNGVIKPTDGNRLKTAAIANINPDLMKEVFKDLHCIIGTVSRKLDYANILKASGLRNSPDNNTKKTEEVSKKVYSIEQNNPVQERNRNKAKVERSVVSKLKEIYNRPTLSQQQRL